MSQELKARLVARLTEDQQRIVGERGLGPIKVLAAAGSGKTTTMAALYGLGVLDELLPSQILAVTFTERAAEELSQRISSTLAEVGWSGPGSGVLDGAWIGTFHHVARRLISEHSYLAQLPRDLRTLDDVEARMELERAAQKVRDELPRNQRIRSLFPRQLHPRGLLAVSNGVVDAVSRLRSTELTPDECRRLSSAAYGRFASDGDPADELSWHRLALEVTLAAWQEYEWRLSSQRSVDFDGLLRLALTALTQSSALRNWCHDNFRLVIVDEFQDTSAVQSALLDQLVGSRRQKLFVVGDARQSIFAFRDAKPGIMDAAPGRCLRLFQNHRSLRPILAAADHVIRADQQFAADLPMEGVRQEGQEPPVLLGFAPDHDREAEGIAQFLATCHQDGIPGRGGELRRVGYGEMAVLAYTFSKLGVPLEEALRRRGIPFRTATGGLLQRPEIKDALALLRLTADPGDDLAWIRVMQSAWIRVGDSEMLRLCTRSGAAGRSIRDRIESALPTSGLAPDLAVRVRRLLSTAEDLHASSRVMGAPQLVSEALSASGLVTYHEARALKDLEDGKRALASLRSLIRIAVSAQAEGSWLGLPQFLERLATMAAVSGRAEPPPLDDRPVVTLSTIHRAKGLEWPVVVLADCRPHHQRARPAVVWDRGDGCVVMPSVAGKATAAGQRWKSTADARVGSEEHRRLVYVAMTRARDLLLVSTTRTGATAEVESVDELVAKCWEGSVISGEFGELVSALAVGEDWVQALPGFPDSVQLPWSSDPGATKFSTPQPEAPVDPRVADLESLSQTWEQLEASSALSPPNRLPAPARVSFSGLRMLELCPRQYWFRHVARFQPPGQPSGSEGPDRSRELGSLVHQVLERAHRTDRDSGPSSASVQRIAEELGRGLPAPEVEQAVEMLRGYCEMEVARLPTLATELPFFWRGWAGAGVPPLVGVVDRVAKQEDGSRLVLDYKTDRGLSVDQLTVYSHQLRLYTMALDAAQPPPVPTTSAGLVVLRSREVVSVECSKEAMRSSLNWAEALALKLRSSGDLSALGHPERPCADCPFEPICPERLPRAWTEVVGKGVN